MSDNLILSRQASMTNLNPRSAHPEGDITALLSLGLKQVAATTVSLRLVRLQNNFDEALAED